MVEMTPMKTWLIIKLMVLAIVVYSLLTYWTDWFQEFVIEKLNLGKTSKGLFIFAIIATLMSIVIFVGLKINPVYILDINTKKLGFD